MNKQELDNYLSAKKPINSAMLFGACDYLADFYTQKIVDSAGSSCDILRMYFDEYSFLDAKSFISQNSLFGDKLILLIKSDKKIPKEEIKELITLAHKNGALFVFRFFGDLTNKEKDYCDSFSIDKNSFWCRFFPPSQREAKSYLADEAKRFGMEITDDAIDHLLELKHLNLKECIRELEKLGTLARKVSLKDVRSLVDESEEGVLERFFELVLSKGDFYVELFRLLEKAEYDEVRLVLAFEHYIYELYLFFLFIKTNGYFDARQITGKAIPESVAKAKAERAKKAKESFFANCFEVLTEADLALKTKTATDKRALLLEYLIKLQNKL